MTKAEIVEGLKELNNLYDALVADNAAKKNRRGYQQPSPTDAAIAEGTEKLGELLESAGVEDGDEEVEETEPEQDSQ